MKIIKRLRLASHGFGHIESITALVVIAVVAVIGVKVLTSSHADTPNYSQYIKVSALNVNNTLSRANPANVTGGLIYGNGFNITGVQNTSFELIPNTTSQGVGFYTSSGGLGAGDTDKIQTYINPDKANGHYTGSYTLKYYLPSTKQWLDGPTINYSINLVNNFYTDYLTISSLKSTVTFSKSSKPNVSGLLSINNPVITGVQSTSFQISYNQPTQGVGFYISSSGLTKGQVVDLQTYINPNQPIGTHSGSATLQYTNSSGQWVNGPTLDYNVTLTK